MRHSRPLASALFGAGLILAVAHTTQAATPWLAGDTVEGSVRRTTQPVGTNLFSNSTAIVGNGGEFFGNDIDFSISADLQATDFVNLSVVRTAAGNGSGPLYRFRFDDLDFHPDLRIAGLTRLNGTPGINLSDVAFGDRWAEFTMNSAFVISGGSYGVSIRFDTAPIPEPASLGLLTAAVGAVLLRRRRA